MTTPIVQSITDEIIEGLERRVSIGIGRHVTAEEIESILQRLRAAEADAKRYRWLRDKKSMPGVVCTNPQVDKYFNEYMMCGEVMDKAIDAAMEPKP